MIDSPKYSHMAGIIPLANFETDFNFMWDDCLMPIGNNLTLIEAAAIRCAWAGCDTIWIAANEGMQMAVKKQLGDFINDPITRPSIIHGKVKGKASVRRIPIFFTAVPFKDVGKRDSYAWSIICAARAASLACAHVSRWVVPQRFFVSFPFSMFDGEELRRKRADIKKHKRWYATWKNEDVRNGAYLPFSFSTEDWKVMRRYVLKEGTGRYKKLEGSHAERMEKVLTNDREGLPPEERWSARRFTLEQVTDQIPSEDEASTELSWYHDVSSWENWSKFMKTDHVPMVRNDFLLPQRKFKPIGEDL